MTPVAVWELDGALAHGDTLWPFLRRLAGTTALVQAAIPVAGRRALGADVRGRVRADVVQRLLGGRELTEVEPVARTFASRLTAGGLRPDSLRRWLWHRRHGHRLVLASGGLDLYLRHIATYLGAHEIICTRLEVVNGWLTGRMSTRDCHGREKGRRLREHLDARPGNPVWVYGAGSADRFAMTLADVPIRVGRHPLYAFDDA